MKTMKYWVVILVSMILIACGGGGEDDGSDIPVRKTNYRVDFAPEMVIGGTAAPNTVTATASLSSQQGDGIYAAGSVNVSGTNATSVTINAGYAGENGPVVVTLNNADGGTWNVPAATEIDFDDLYRLDAAGYYVSIQSPDGELRGQIVPQDWVATIIELDANSVVPASTSTGSAKAGLSFNPSTGTYRIRISVSGVSDAISAAVRNAITGARGEVAILLEQSVADPDVWGSRDINNVNADDFFTQSGLNLLASGALYFSLASTTNMNGELRGQIVDDTINVFNIELSTSEVVSEVPILSDAQGVATVTWIESLSRFGVVVNTDITNALGVFVHQGAPGTDGPVLCTLSSDPMLPGNWVLAPTDLDTDETIAYLNGDFYVTVQTNAYPSGELRGQLDPDFSGLASYSYKHNFGTKHLSIERGQHTATLLNDGTVLITGGISGVINVDTAEVYDPVAGQFSALVNSMTSVRSSHTATLLNDGSVLITGGYNGSDYVDTAEIYDPTDGIFTPLANSLTSIRANHTATLLSNGTVLITGGFNGSAYVDTAEIYDPTDGSFTPAFNAMTSIRGNHTATLLNDGTVLITGGFNGSAYVDTAEIYDPTDGSFTPASNTMPFVRGFHTATLLNDGTVLITGGWNGGAYVDIAEIYDPTNGKFTLVASRMTSMRGEHTATLLNDGSVLITGGYNGSAYFDTVEIFDPSNDRFTPLITPSLITARSRHTATLLNDGTVLIAGGWNGSTYLDTAEVYDPTDGSFTPLANPMTSVRGNHAATLLNDGRVLITGGFNGSSYIDTAEIYDPTDGNFAPLTNTMTSMRTQHTATLLNDGTVLIIGGWSGGFYHDTAEFYDPSDGTFTLANFLLTERRSDHTATLLNDGTVLITGGWNGSTFHNFMEIYNPSVGRYSPVLDPFETTSGISHTATLLVNGTVLITEGWRSGSGYLDTAAIYDPTNGNLGNFTPAANTMASARIDHTATLLNDGTVLIVGGEIGSAFVDIVEFFY